MLCYQQFFSVRKLHHSYSPTNTLFPVTMYSTSLCYIKLQVHFIAHYSVVLQQRSHSYLYCCTVYFEYSLNIVHQQMHQSYITYQFKIIYIRKISLLLNFSIAHCISLSGSTYSSQLKSQVKILMFHYYECCGSISYVCVCVVSSAERYVDWL